MAESLTLTISRLRAGVFSGRLEDPAAGPAPNVELRIRGEMHAFERMQGVLDALRTAGRPVSGGEREPVDGHARVELDAAQQRARER